MGCGIRIYFSFLPFLFSFFTACNKEPESGNANSRSSQSSESSNDVIVTGSLAVEAADQAKVGESFSVANREVLTLDESGKEIGRGVTGADGSFAVVVPGQLAVGVEGMASRLVSYFLASPTLRIRSIASDTADSSIVGFQEPVTLSGNRYVDLGQKAMKEITAIRGRVLMDGARDHTGIAVYVPGTSYAARTDSAGQFFLTFIPAGSYDLVMERDGYIGKTVSGISVVENKTTKVGDEILRLNGGAANFSVKQIGEEGRSKSRIVEFLISPGDADRFRGGLEDEVANLPYGFVPELFRYEFDDDGTYTLAMIFANADGFESTVRRTIIVDTEKPSAGGIRLADTDTLSLTHTNSRDILAYHSTCNDIAKVAIMPHSSGTPRDTDFVWPCHSVASTAGVYFQIPANVTSYSYQIWAMDRVGNISEGFASGTILYDDQPPLAPDFQLSDQTSGSTLGTDITTVAVTFGSCADTKRIFFSETQLTAPSANQFTLDCSTAPSHYTYTFSNNIPGLKTVVAWAMDYAGNIGPVSASASIELDQSAPNAPTFTLADPTEASAGYANSLALNATIANCDGISHVLINETQSTRPDENDAGWVPCDATNPVAATALAAGNRTLLLWARDIGGNVSLSSSSATIIVDTTPPDVTQYTFIVKDATSNSESYTNAASIAVSLGTCDSESDKVYFSESTVAPVEGDFTLSCGVGLYTGTYTLSNNTNGSKSLYAWVRDRAGNISAANLSKSIVLDTVAPDLPTTFSVSSLITGSSAFVNSDNVAFNIDTCPVGDLFLIRQDQSTAPTESDGSWTLCNTSGTFNGVVSAGDGAKNIYLWKKDPAGNIAGSLQHTITRDNNAPSQPVVTSPASNYFTQNVSLTLTGTAEADGYVLVSGGASPATFNVDNSGNWSGSVTLQSNVYNSLALVTRDRAGNDSAIQYLAATHDTVAPTTPGVVVTPRHNEATLVVTTNETTNIVIDWGTSISYGNQLTGTGTSYHSINITGLVGGMEYFYRVTATDLAGNSAVGSTYSGSFKTYIQKGGTIFVDETWSDTTTPYLVTASILVSSGVKLTINPGVTVRIDSGKQIWIDGMLVARGNLANRIQFVPQAAGSGAGLWNSIHFTATSTGVTLDGSGNYLDGNILEYADIKQGGSGEGMITLDGSELALFNVRVEYAGNSYYGDYNNKDAVNVSANSQLYVRDSAFYEIYGNAISFNSVATGTSILEVKRTTFERIGQTPIYLRSAIYDGTVTVEDSTFTNFKANWMGAGRCAICTETSGTTPIPNINIRRNSINLSMSAYDTAGLVINGGAAKTVNIEDNLISKAGYFGITFIAKGSVTLNFKRNVVVDCGYTAFRFNATSSGSVLNIEQNTIIGNGQYNESTGYTGQTTAGATVNLLNNLFYGNDYSSNAVVSVMSDSTETYTINGNSFVGNSSTYALKTSRSSASAAINATGNYWGTTDSAAIAALIFDNADDFSKNIVTTTGALAAHAATTPMIPPQNVVNGGVNGNDVSLSWNANTESDTAGYRIYYGQSSYWPFNGTGATSGNSGIDVGNVTNFTLEGLPSGTHYITVTAYDTTANGTNDQVEGYESWFSQAVWVYIP